MHPVDWLIVAAYLAWVVVDGLRRTKDTGKIEGYFLAHRSLPWWAVGLSVMATQLSAITLVGTTGQGYDDGLRFVQFYYGLPLAMIILSLTLVPFFNRARVYTAYEYLEQRFDPKTRTFTSLLFLISRGLSCGVIIAAPAVILSIVLQWNLTLTILAIGLPTTVYTMFGGVQAVTWADVKQMFVIVFAVGATAVVLVLSLPEGVSVAGALHLAGVTGRLQTIDLRFDLTETYTFWSGMIGGLFLALAYFGCDQSQVQRYLAAKSTDEGRHALMMSAYFKIPLQVVILLLGVFVFVFYQFHQPPMLFNPVYEERVRGGEQAAAYAALEGEFNAAFEERRRLAAAFAATTDEEASTEFVAANQRVAEIRQRAAALVREATGDQAYRDVNYVFPTFVTTQLPIGLVGLFIAAVFAAAMSSIAAELNALSTASIIDFYRRFARPSGTDGHYLLASKLATGVWGLFACGVAMYTTQLGSLIEVVNRFGSFFYGSILGVFVLAIAFRAATGNGAFVGLLAGMGTVAWFASATSIAFLWHNVIGAVTVVLVGLLVSAVDPARRRRPDGAAG